MNKLVAPEKMLALSSVTREISSLLWWLLLPPPRDSSWDGSVKLGKLEMISSAPNQPSSSYESPVVDVAVVVISSSMRAFYLVECAFFVVAVAFLDCDSYQASEDRFSKWGGHYFEEQKTVTGASAY